MSMALINASVGAEKGEGPFERANLKDSIPPWPGHGDYPDIQISFGELAESPLIAVLRKEVKEGVASAVEKFWTDARQRGAPLVETIPGDDRYVLITFLWRARGELANVAIIPTGIDDPAGNQMTRLLNTDVWYRTYKERNDLRNTYLLSPNDSLLRHCDIKPTPEKNLKTLLDERRANWRVDPLNPNTFRDDPPNPPYSVIALPGAVPHPYAMDMRQSGVPAGKVEEFSIKSEILGQDRKFRTYTPPGFKKENGPCALMIHFDGPSYTDDFPQQITLNNLIARGEIPPIVVGFVQHTNRSRELACNPAFADFLARELIPWLRARYAVTADPAQTVVAGSSMGGLGSAYVAFRHPECFGNVISFTGAYWCGPLDDEPEWLARQITRAKKKSIRFFMNIGRLENPWHLAANRHMRDVLLAKGYRVRYQEFTGTHCYFCRQGAFADAISHLIGKQKAEFK